MAALRLRKGATCAKWNHVGSKFAVGGAEGIVAIGHYDSSNDWWICKHLKKHFEGPISSVSWHPDGLIVAAASEQGALYLLDASIPAVDRESGNFDGLITKLELGMGISFICFNPSGSQILCLCTFRSSHLSLVENQCRVVVVNVEGSEVREAQVPSSSLVFTSGAFLSENALLLSNFDGSVYLAIANRNGDWIFDSNLVAEDSKSREERGNGFQGAMSKFRMMDSKGLTQSSASESIAKDHMANSPGHSDKIS